MPFLPDKEHPGAVSARNGFTTKEKATRAGGLSAGKSDQPAAFSLTVCVGDGEGADGS